MSNPLYLPHLLGISLGASGIPKTQVVARNRTTGDFIIKATDAGKLVVFDAANFTSGYAAGDVIEFQNVGASVGTSTITINSASGGFQETSITSAAASTVSISL